MYRSLLRLPSIYVLSGGLLCCAGHDFDLHTLFSPARRGCAPLLAQDGAGQGGIIIDPNANSGTDVATMNPLLNNDVYSAIITGLLFPNLIGIDPEKGVFVPGARNGLANDWSISDDGLTYTYTLRDDWNWSDGTPITAQDFVFSYNAIASGKTSSPRSYAVAAINKVEAPDDHTLVITYNSPACNNLDNTNAIVPVPSQAIQAQIGERLLQDRRHGFQPESDGQRGSLLVRGVRGGAAGQPPGEPGLSRCDRRLRQPDRLHLQERQRYGRGAGTVPRRRTQPDGYI